MIMRSQGELFFSFWESPYEKEPDWFQYLFLLSFGDFFVGYISSLNLKSYESDIFTVLHTARTDLSWRAKKSVCSKLCGMGEHKWAV